MTVLEIRTNRSDKLNENNKKIKVNKVTNHYTLYVSV